jgi:hypothetical protein
VSHHRLSDVQEVGKGCAFLSNCTACGTASKCVAHYDLSDLEAHAEDMMASNETAVCMLMAMAPMMDIGSMSEAPASATNQSRKMLESESGDMVRVLW